jgi:hemerythrin
MAVQWSDDLSVGVEMIDTQHKELINAVNRLTDAMWEGKGSEETGKLLNFLAEYVVTHFGSEERLMVKHQFPGYEAHKEAHDRFVKDFLRTKSQYDKGEITTSLAIKVLDETWEWLRLHIRVVDKELGRFIGKSA